MSMMSNRVFASPLARRLAAEKGIDLQTVSGTGPGGRIVRVDIEKALPGSRESIPPARTLPAPAGPNTSPEALAKALGMVYKAVPNSGMRRTIARRLSESKQTVPHFYVTADCEIDALLKLRDEYAVARGIKPSINDFIIKAVALALKKVPDANVWWTDDAILHFDHADIAVAVATEGGLMTPVVHGAEARSISEISAQMKDLGLRARAGKLKPEEYQGGTFSISNMGMLGVKQFSAIINPPQACILAVGAGEQRPVVRDGKIVPATVMTCTLSVDHRAVDGALAAKLMAAFKAQIEEPLELVL